MNAREMKKMERRLNLHDLATQLVFIEITVEKSAIACSVLSTRAKSCPRTKKARGRKREISKKMTSRINYENQNKTKGRIPAGGSVCRFPCSNAASISLVNQLKSR